MAMVNRSIDEMARVHARDGRTPVRPSLYANWIDSLIAAVREKDPEATPALLERWRTAMGIAVEKFTMRY